jgi:hypothetical protein
MSLASAKAGLSIPPSAFFAGSSCLTPQASQLQTWQSLQFALHLLSSLLSGLFLDNSDCGGVGENRGVCFPPSLPFPSPLSHPLPSSPSYSLHLLPFSFSSLLLFLPSLFPSPVNGGRGYNPREKNLNLQMLICEI